MYPLDIPTFAVVLLLYTDKMNFSSSLLIFIAWFIFTDIYRARETVYGTYISRWFYTSSIKINNSKWVLHIADVDPFPSVPHMHSLEYPLKLDIYTGEIYNVKSKKLIFTANKKELEKLWSDKKFIGVVHNARNEYLRNNPSYILSEMPTFKKRA